jgi:protein-S-isoprenylcysteine O-methyltransferase Ste14
MFGVPLLILLILYYKLARREEKQVLKEYEEAYLKYKENTADCVRLVVTRLEMCNFCLFL